MSTRFKFEIGDSVKYMGFSAKIVDRFWEMDRVPPGHTNRARYEITILRGPKKGIWMAVEEKLEGLD